MGGEVIENALYMLIGANEKKRLDLPKKNRSSCPDFEQFYHVLGEPNKNYVIYL